VKETETNTQAHAHSQTPIHTHTHRNTATTECRKCLWPRPLRPLFEAVERKSMPDHESRSGFQKELGGLFGSITTFENVIYCSRTFGFDSFIEGLILKRV